jgi:hypothetical protein
VADDIAKDDAAFQEKVCFWERGEKAQDMTLTTQDFGTWFRAAFIFIEETKSGDGEWKG